MKTVLFMMFPTLIITFLLGYEYIGLATPIILITSRLVQGFGFGGEFSGVAVYGVELVKKDRGFTVRLIRSVGFLGTTIGTAIASLMTLSFMPFWAWRISFLIGATATLYSYFLRKRMEESKYFEEIKEKDQIEKALVKIHKFRIITIFLVSVCAYVFLYFSTIYMNSLYSDKFGFAPTSNLVISTILIVGISGIDSMAGVVIFISILLGLAGLTLCKRYVNG